MAFLFEEALRKAQEALTSNPTAGFIGVRERLGGVPSYLGGGGANFIETPITAQNTFNPTFEDQIRGVGAESILPVVEEAKSLGIDTSDFENQAAELAKGASELARSIPGEQARARQGSLISQLGQGLRERVGIEKLRRQFKGEIFGTPTTTLEEALQPGAAGELGQLGRALGAQQKSTFETQLFPLIQQRLNQLGILEGGALGAVSERTLAELEGQRQSGLLQAGLGASESLRNLKLGQATSEFGLQRSLQTQRFQGILEAERSRLIRELSESTSGGGLLGALQGALGGTSLGSFFGIPGKIGGAIAGGFLGASNRESGPGIFGTSYAARQLFPNLYNYNTPGVK